MPDSTSPSARKLSEQAVKDAIESLNWPALEGHLIDIAIARGDLTEICGHLRRCTDLICKYYPNRKLERRRATFLEHLESFAATHFGSDAAAEVASESLLLQQIERGYRGLLDVLGRCAIANRPSCQRKHVQIAGRPWRIELKALI